ncbi:MAG: tRNA (guanosine(37)-N1)-methyltransferase TrmD [Verrucomicrobia bacterium]|nr:tRNA (guanosine(37)-N1)-methyltransferase TrmD [Verrucomicrobiota bacterium]
MQVDILSLFPEYFEGPLKLSILGRAIASGLLDVRLTNIRSFTTDKHGRVDDKPFGGGPGMLMTPQPICDAIRAVRKEKTRVIYLTPQGKKLTAKRCEELAKEEHLVLLCGHYEGIDQRAIEAEVDEEISIGDYVLTSGCPAALVLLDATVRFIPGVLGHEEGAMSDSFQSDGLLEGPQYTRPRVFEGKSVPSALIEGNHAEIAKWRRQAALYTTKLMKENV